MLIVNLVTVLKLLSKVVVPIYSPVSSTREFQFLYIFTDIDLHFGA